MFMVQFRRSSCSAVTPVLRRLSGERPIPSSPWNLESRGLWNPIQWTAANLRFPLPTRWICRWTVLDCSSISATYQIIHCHATRQGAEVLKKSAKCANSVVCMSCRRINCQEQRLLLRVNASTRMDCLLRAHEIPVSSIECVEQDLENWQSRPILGIKSPSWFHV